MHLLIKSYGLAFTVCHRRRFDFLRSLPLRAEPVGNPAQFLDPMIDQGERQVFLGYLGLGDQDWLDPGHLVIVGGSGDAEEDRLGEAGENGEAEEAGDEEEDFLRLVGMDAYQNHSNYDSYKQRLCHSGPARLSVPSPRNSS